MTPLVPEADEVSHRRALCQKENSSPRHWGSASPSYSLRFTSLPAAIAMAISPAPSRVIEAGSGTIDAVKLPCCVLV